jgi:hypothetical protein
MTDRVFYEVEFASRKKFKQPEHDLYSKFKKNDPLTHASAWRDVLDIAKSDYNGGQNRILKMKLQNSNLAYTLEMKNGDCCIYTPQGDMIMSQFCLKYPEVVYFKRSSIDSEGRQEFLGYIFGFEGHYKAKGGAKEDKEKTQLIISPDLKTYRRETLVNDKSI